VAVWNVSVDHLNRPVLMTNATKVAMWTAVWQPWGGAHSITGTATLDTRLPGQWYQSETGLHYNWHRSYDPTVGRYTQPDPLGFVDGPSVYGYAGGKPQSLVDIDGRNPGTGATIGGNIGQGIGTVGGPPGMIGGRIIGTVVGGAIGLYCFRNKVGKGDPAYQKCIKAAEGSDVDWDGFCDSIPTTMRLKAAGNSKAQSACRGHKYSTPTEKKNWCELQFGG
jgi:RHS repeat-associated protein